MRHGSLFSGIGGFDLAASWMSWKNVFQCESDPFCRKILKYYWPDTAFYEDIRRFKASKYKATIDILAGGFPCQSFSTAGTRKGTKDERFLWPEMCRVIGEIQPSWVVGENVLGFLNWKRGMAFEQMQVDLEAQGYEVQSFILPAAGVGAPHRRSRVWIVAHTRGNGRGGYPKTKAFDDQRFCERMEKRYEFNAFPGYRNAACPIPNERFPGEQIKPASDGKNRGTIEFESWRKNGFWHDFPTQSPVCSGNDGLSSQLDNASIYKWRKESIKAYGNSVVPQVAFQIFQAIEKMVLGGF
jgi:DNA (cytosine-5)-methyltransferase 1